MKTALVPLAQGCEELEAITITDILARAGIRVTTAGLNGDLVTASRGAVLKPDADINDLVNNHYDLIVLPGGLPGADHLANSAPLLSMLQSQYDAGKTVAAVCAAPKVLAKAGILPKHRYTCYPTSLDECKLEEPSTGEAVVVDQNVITGRGPGVALDFALTLVEQLCGRDKKTEVELALVR
ncbi:DJ-1 family glyoxalase III [Reinekea marinisedimentorum]|uniref:4-methyl-5(B-hydroxyethyl)-thiazole monophosphate biosynthesis n=1 Tax=Reinekea marinisedimentorum TaxID=230495 RepID=A0A4R3I9J3_9GAMM|nr:DJ-1 family glyoxalase III [Reinekea marinisedimentorum]TCS43069.1 4-methyl-5(b-hydroxyethyl)-thiazole monophosphate biosynthesis [Reinekea marinisedimentorum]